MSARPHIRDDLFRYAGQRAFARRDGAARAAYRTTAHNDASSGAARDAQGAFARGESRGSSFTPTNRTPKCFRPEAAAHDCETTGGAPLEAAVARPSSGAALRSSTFNGALIEAALDEGRIVAGERKARIAELELELKRGDPSALFDFASALTDMAFASRPRRRALRGHWLATGEAPARDARHRARAVARTRRSTMSSRRSSTPT